MLPLPFPYSLVPVVNPLKVALLKVVLKMKEWDEPLDHTLLILGILAARLSSPGGLNIVFSALNIARGKIVA